MLGRFQGPNRIAQMMGLLESSPLDRREELLGHLEKEDRSLAILLRSRTLSLDRILRWPPALLCPLLARLPDEFLGRLALNLELLMRAQSGSTNHPVDPLFQALRNLRAVAGSDRVDRAIRLLKLHRGANDLQATDRHLEVLVISLARDLEREGLIDLRHYDPPVAGTTPKSA